MTTQTETQQHLFQAAMTGANRAIRFFNSQLEVVWDNQPDRFHAYPIFRDRRGRPVPIPPKGIERNAWPVHRALSHHRREERNYWVKGDEIGLDRCYRVSAWPVDLEGSGEVHIVEEIERIDTAQCHDKKLQSLDTELKGLIGRITDFIARSENADFFRIRLENPNLQSCREIKGCKNRPCPSFKSSDNGRCWEVDGTLCPDLPDPQNALMKFQHCEQCDVFLLACPDPLTRVGENINRLLSLIQIKHQEALDAHQQVQQTEKMAAIGELTLGIAHEIKTPLSVILGRLDCLALEFESLTGEELKDDLEVMRSHALRMRHSLEDLMSLARPSPPQRKVFHLNELIVRTLQIVRKTLERSGVEIDLGLNESLPPVKADPLQLQQALLNLTLNARDAMPDGGRLTVSTERENATGGGPRITVRDTGAGVLPEDAERIFAPFFTTKSESGGTGLGLSVCRRIMERHGGTIRMESQPGNGTVFQLIFPPSIFAGEAP